MLVWKSWRRRNTVAVLRSVRLQSNGQRADREWHTLYADGIQVRLPIIITENMIEIKQADRNNFCETSMDSFDRFQEVQNVWRTENGRLVLNFQPFTETWSPEQRRKKAGEILSGRYITFCAFEGDAVVGEIMLIPELNENRLIIDSFHVSRGFRRCGIGRRLLETVADYARGRGASALYASC